MANCASRAAAEFGKRVNLLRRQKRWSQEKLAAEADLEKGYLGRIERGEVNIGIENIARIAKALSVPIAELFYVGEPRPVGRQPVSSVSKTPPLKVAEKLDPRQDK